MTPTSTAAVPTSQVLQIPAGQVMVSRRLLFVCLRVLWFNVSVNNYGHVEMVT